MQRRTDPVPSTPPRRGDLRQATLVSVNDFAPFNRSDDIDQLEHMYYTIRDLIRESIGFEDAEVAINNLQGHRDIKDMFAGLNNMDYISFTRFLLDILELIRNKVDALEALDGLEQVNASIEETTVSDDERAELSTDTETESDADDSDDEPAPRVNRRLVFDSDSDSDDEVVDIANADTEPPSLRF